MQPGNIVNIVEGVCFALIIVAVLTGKLVGRRTKNPIRSLLFVTVAAIGINLLLLVAAKPTADRIGWIVMRQALLLGFTLAVVLIGGFAAGVAQQRGKQSATVFIALITVALAGAGMFAFVVRVNEVLALPLGSGQRYEPEKNKDCPENLKSLYIAFQQYAQDWDALPPAANWMANEELVNKVTRDEWLHCPAVSNRNDDKYGYAYNDAVAGMKMSSKHALADLPNAARTPMLYDSTTLEKSAHDALKSLPKPGRHSGRNNILYLDGHVQAVAP